MRIERTKNATRNIAFGIAQKVYQTVLPFIMRTAIIYYMGVQYLGLNSLFASILQVLNLAELGVSSAMVFSMYKPIADDDKGRICALMGLYKMYYRYIGLIIAVVGIVITPIVPKLIQGELPNGVNIYVLYLLNLSATVLTYWLFAYKNALLQAHQRTDVVSKITLLVDTFKFLAQIIVLRLFKNYYLYVIVVLLSQALSNVITAFFASKMYPEYVAKGRLDDIEVKEINRRIRDLFTSKVGAVIVNSADAIVISAFLGLTMLAIYQNYFFILTAVLSFVTVVFNSCTAGIGNSLITETCEKNFNDFKKFTFIISWIAGVCSCCFLNLYQPFMEIWVGKNLLLEFSAVICFCVYYYVYEINQLLNTYKDAGGIWHKDRFRPLVTALFNLTLNIVMVQFWGIYGVLLSTVLSMLLIGMPWILVNLFSTLFERKSLKEYLKKVMLYAIVSFFSCCLTYFLCNQIRMGAWTTLIIKQIICLLVPNIVFYVIYRNLQEFKDSLILINKMTKGMLKRRMMR